MIILVMSNVNRRGGSKDFLIVVMVLRVRYLGDFALCLLEFHTSRLRFFFAVLKEGKEVGSLQHTIFKGSTRYLHATVFHLQLLLLEA